MTTALSVERMPAGEVLAEGQLRHVFVEPETLRKRPIPDSVRAGLERHTAGRRPAGLMLHLRIVAPPDRADRVMEVLCGSDSVLNVVRLEGVAQKPDGDLILCDVAREDASVIIGDLKELEIPRLGSIAVETRGQRHLGRRGSRRSAPPRACRRTRWSGRRWSSAPARPPSCR